MAGSNTAQCRQWYLMNFTIFGNVVFIVALYYTYSRESTSFANYFRAPRSDPEGRDLAGRTVLYDQLIQALGDAIQAVLEFGDRNKKPLGEEG